jgi:hypothetical protein
MTPRIRNALLILGLLMIAVSTPLVSQTTTTPGILGWYPAGGVWIRVQVDANGKLVTSSGGGGSGCVGTVMTPCVVGGSAAAGAAIAGNPVPFGVDDGTDVRYASGDSSGNLNVNVKTTPIPTGAGTFASGQTAVTGTAAALPSHAANSVCVEALIGNTINVYLGATGVTTSTGFETPPGQTRCFDVNNTNLVFVVASTTGASVSWLYTD